MERQLTIPPMTHLTHMSRGNVLSIVVPCYNEQEVLPET